MAVPRFGTGARLAAASDVAQWARRCGARRPTIDRADEAEKGFLRRRVYNGPHKGHSMTGIKDPDALAREMEFET